MITQSTNTWGERLEVRVPKALGLPTQLVSVQEFQGPELQVATSSEELTALPRTFEK